MISRNAVIVSRRQPHTVFCRTLVSESRSGSSTDPHSIPYQRPTRPRISTAIVLNRSPIITRTPTLFERAYYAYQARIRRALHNPFPFDFYFKQGSLIETRFNMEERKRERRAFGPTFGLEEEFVSKEKAAVDKAAADQLALQEGETQDMMTRVHTSDANRDLKSLDRKGKRNIYLLLQTKENMWRFPQGSVEKGELLHQAAQRDLQTECGTSMDTWIVSRNPIGVYKPVAPSVISEDSQPENVTFFFKAHIIAGQVRLTTTSTQDFAWLTKQEIESRVDKGYWNSVKDLLSDH